MRLTIDSHDQHHAWTWASVVFAVGAVVLTVFGLPPIDIHGPLHYAGIMDPFCGGTRATLALARGDLATGFHYNPGVPFLAVAMLAGIVRGAVGVVTGRWVTVRWRRLVLVVAVLSVVALEVNQQLHAELLMASGIQTG
ncbi:MAG: DUF2752 domain-containing protein [Acidimicrobiales bacterium]